MPDIRHRVEMLAPRAHVYRAVATTEGLSSWWTRDAVRGEPRVGGELAFHFGSPEPSAVMEVTRLDPASGVDWTCVGGADEWIGTHLSFDLSSSDETTIVLFSHRDWRHQTEFMAHCSARWAYFLLSIKHLVETGHGTPFPNDLKF